MSVYVPERENDRFTGFCSTCRRHLREHKEGRECPVAPVPRDTSHRVVLTFDDGVYGKLICPDDGSCKPGTVCSQCGRDTTDPESGEGCYDCEGGLGEECWIKSWFDNLTPEELLKGKLEVAVRAEWNGEAPTLHILAERVEEASER